jgi:ABC-type multidrug transport system fused ATPase/permease subunit
MEDKTTIVIAHRLTTIKKMDKIVVLNFWEIIESGTYDELINSKGKLYELANPDKLMIA